MSHKPTVLVVNPNVILGTPLYKELNNIGYQAELFFENYNTKFSYSGLKKIKNLIRRNLFGDKDYYHYLEEKHYEDYCSQCIIKTEKTSVEKYDFGVVFSLHKIPLSVLSYLRKKVKKLVAYQYDGLLERPVSIEKFSYVDKIFSFNPLDCISNSFLYFTTNYHFNLKKTALPLYDILYLGSGVGNRIRILERLSAEIPSFKNYFYIGGDYVNKEDSHIKFGPPVSYKENLDLCMKAKAVLDLKLPGHDGLSFRFFEALNFEVKVITDNPSVKGYNFYHPDNILVTNFENTDEIKEFLKIPYQRIDEHTVYQYSVENWIKYMLDLPGAIPIDLPKLDYLTQQE